MHTPFSLTHILNSKLNHVLPKDIIALYDYDLTLANKNDPSDTDKAPLTREHYYGLRDFADRIGRLVILTARGEKSVLNYLGEHVSTLDDRIPNITLASNSGHLWHKLDIPREGKLDLERTGQPDTTFKPEPTIIPVPGLTRAKLLTVTAEIHKIASRLHSEFPDINYDLRELCGAVIHQFPADAGSDPKTFSRFDAFTQRAEQLRLALPEDIRKQVKYAAKAWEGIDDDGVSRKMGYIDILPAGLNKGISARHLFEHYAAENPNAFVVVAGDSTADYDMMMSLAEFLPPSRRLFISVGEGLVTPDNAYKQRHQGVSLLDCVIQGVGNTPTEKQGDAIDKMHMLIEGLGRRNTALDNTHRAGAVVVNADTLGV